jgi:hypothetical protein
VADIFEEVDEELKEENFKKLWDRFGRYIVAAVVLIVAGTAANVGWRSYSLDRQQGFSERLYAAVELAEKGKKTDATAAFAVLAEDADTEFAMLARFREAALRRSEGDTAAAIDIYDAMAADDAMDALYRNLATLLSVMTQADIGDAAELSARLSPLAETGPWRHTAGEYLGLFALQQGDTATARQKFQKIADDLEAPQGARARASELLLTLGK